MMGDISALEPGDFMDTLNVGVYVCDTDRSITYWSRAAERITGWTADEVVGSHCFDGILCHVDKDGHELCGEEYCPLHRAMVTGAGSRAPLLVYARGKDGGRVPMQVSVAPLRDPEGEVIGGVETFRDASAMVRDLERARAIQEISLQHHVPEDPRVSFSAHYTPRDIIGGDYYAISELDEDRYGVMLADITGHGIAAALYTMHLSQLWERFRGLLPHPSEFTRRVNRELFRVVRGDHSFATAISCLLDTRDGMLRFAGAGGPEGILAHADGTHECLQAAGLPLGLVEDAAYHESSADLRRGDSVLLFSDGAVEVKNAAREQLGVEGLLAILRMQGFPESPIRMDAFEEELLRYSNAIRLEDDLTLIEIRIHRIAASRD